MEKLPHDVLSDILIRLPAKPLAKLRSVSKLWKSLLSQPHFINSHLHRSNNINNNAVSVVLFFNPRRNSNLSYTAYDIKNPHIKLPYNFIKHPTKYLEAFINVIGSLNGLICYSTQQREIVHIWNPSLSAQMTLPRNSMNRPTFDHRFIFDIHYRFGFDSKNDDYKVVKLTYARPQTEGLLDRMQVEVYSMRKGSWKLIIKNSPSHITRIFNQDEVCMDGYDGYIHLLGCDGKGLQIIIAFDLGAETFSEISLPDSIKYFDEKRSCVMGILGGMLCVMSSVKDGDDGCDVWLMNKYKVVESWEKHRFLFSFKIRMKPIGFTLNDEFIFEIERSHFALHDPTTNTVKLFNIEYDATARGSMKIVSYVDSLVWEAKNLDSRLWKIWNEW